MRHYVNHSPHARFPAEQDDSPQAAEIVAHVARRTFTTLARDSDTPASEAVERSVEFVSGNFRDDIGIEDMAQVAHLSKFHFLRKFRREVGITPGAFLKRFRIVQAMEQLVESDLAICEIAREVGYRNAAAFSRAFLRTAGTQPCLFRQTRLRKPAGGPAQMSNL